MISLNYENKFSFLNYLIYLGKRKTASRMGMEIVFLENYADWFRKCRYQPLLKNI